MSRATILAICGAALGLSACGGNAMEILAYSSPIEPGDLAVLTVRYRPSVPCTLEFAYATAAPAEDSPGSLPEQETDAAGFTSWRWRFPDSTVPQEVTATATCRRDGEALSDSKTIVVAEPTS